MLKKTSLIFSVEITKRLCKTGIRLSVMAWGWGWLGPCRACITTLKLGFGKWVPGYHSCIDAARTGEKKAAGSLVLMVFVDKPKVLSFPTFSFWLLECTHNSRLEVYFPEPQREQCSSVFFIPLWAPFCLPSVHLEHCGSVAQWLNGIKQDKLFF